MQPPSDSSATLASLNNYDLDDYSSEFLSEYSPFRDSHYLLPLTLHDSLTSSSTLGEALTAITTGATELSLNPDDDPLWATAITSPEREYWVASACDELQSLKDLNVFVLVLCSEILQGQ